MSRRVGIGVVGFGWMGQAHSRSYRRIPTLLPDRAGEPDLLICSEPVAALGVLSWRFEQESGGYGVSSDLLSHVVDLAHVLVGPIAQVVGARVTAIGERPVPRPGASHYGRGRPGDPTGAVTNEDYAALLAR